MSLAGRGASHQRLTRLETRDTRPTSKHARKSGSARCRSPRVWLERSAFKGSDWVEVSMSEGFVQRMAKADDERQPEGFAIAPGVVTNNLDALGLGRVQVRVRLWPQFERWCRMASAGVASGRGSVWGRQMGTEVL